MWQIYFLIGFVVGVLFGLYIYKILFLSTYKAYTEEMQNQYIYLLKKHNIPIKK